MKMNTGVIALNVLLVIGILMFVVLGALEPTQPVTAQVPQPYVYERFEAGGSPTNTNVSDGFTSNERELFEDLKQNKLSNDDIKRLIKDGVLTEVIINKFLKKLNFPGLLKTDKPASKTKAKTKAKADTIEAFSCEATYVGVTKDWGGSAPRWWDGSLATSDADVEDEAAEEPGTKMRGKCGKR